MRHVSCEKGEKTDIVCKQSERGYADCKHWNVNTSVLHMCCCELNYHHTHMTLAIVCHYPFNRLLPTVYSFAPLFLKWTVCMAAPSQPESTGIGYDNSCNNTSIWFNRSPVVRGWIYFLRGWLNENIAEEVIDEKKEIEMWRSGKAADSEGENKAERSEN